MEPFEIMEEGERERLDYKGTGITLTDENWIQLYDASKRGEKEAKIEVWGEHLFGENGEQRWISITEEQDKIVEDAIEARGTAVLTIRFQQIRDGVLWWDLPSSCENHFPWLGREAYYEMKRRQVARSYQCFLNYTNKYSKWKRSDPCIKESSL